MVYQSVLSGKKNCKPSIQNLQARLDFLRQSPSQEFLSLKSLLRTLWKPFYAEWYACQFLAAKEFLAQKCDVFLEKLDGRIAHFHGKNLSFLCDAAYPAVVWEVFCAKIYEFAAPPPECKKCVVIDIGANRAYAALYFARQNWCKKVCGFELFGENLEFARRNVAQNDAETREKIHVFPFGLAAKTGEIEATYYENADGESSFVPALSKKNGKGAKKVQCRVKKASEILKKIAENEKDQNFVIKIDAEGAEYEIFEDLAGNFPQIFAKTVKIVGETHFGFEKFLKIFNGKCGISWQTLKKTGRDDSACLFELSRA